MTLRIKDLHEAYQTATNEEAIQMANIGAICYKTCKSGLYEQWLETITGDENGKAKKYRDEGRQEGEEITLGRMMSKIQMMEETKLNLAAAEGQIKQIRNGIEVETTRRVKEVLETYKKDYEIKTMERVHKLEEKIAETRGKENAYKMIEEGQQSMKMEIERLKMEIKHYKETISTKSSHAIGKIGEGEISEMLSKYVLPQFPYAEIKNMTTEKHKGDFHITVIGQKLRKVKILLDTKKYSKPVQSLEIEKLYNDVDGDETIEAGLMISMDTTIYTKSQFQITETKKRKPCMFITFEKIDDGIRQEALCWAIRSLVSIATVTERGERDEIIEEIETCMKEMESSMEEVGGCIKTAKTLHEMLTGMKERMIKRMEKCRIKCGMEEIKSENVETKCNGRKANGERCKLMRKGGSEYCARHMTTKMESGDILDVALHSE